MFINQRFYVIIIMALIARWMEINFIWTFSSWWTNIYFSAYDMDWISSPSSPTKALSLSPCSPHSLFLKWSTMLMADGTKRLSRMFKSYYLLTSQSRRLYSMILSLQMQVWFTPFSHACTSLYWTVLNWRQYEGIMKFYLHSSTYW